MMNEEIHPLDRDDDELEAPARRETQTLQRRLLKYCIWTGIICGAAICIASAATANAAYQSPAQRIGEITQRVAGFGALAACVGMLVAFRINAIHAAIENARQRAAQPRTRQIRTNVPSQSTEQQPYSKGSHLMQPSDSNYSADLGLPAVLIGGLVYLVVCWILAFALRPFPSLAYTIPSLMQSALLGLSVTIIVFNTGVTRAFAIGFLATSALSVFGIMSSLFMFLEGSGYSRGGPNSMLTLGLPIAMTTSVVCGWICATYVWVLQRVFTPTAMPPHNPSDADGLSDD